MLPMLPLGATCAVFALAPEDVPFSPIVLDGRCNGRVSSASIDVDGSLWRCRRSIVPALLFGWSISLKNEEMNEIETE